MAGQLTGLHVKLTGDSTSARNATKLLAFEMNKLDAKQREVKRNADALATSSAALAKDFHRLKMETDASYAAMERFKKAAETTKRVAQDQKWTTEQLSAELGRLANHFGVAEAAGISMNEQVRSARFHTANLAAQFNDIGVMLAAGQSPFMLAVQQGTQITQVLQDLGGTAREQFSALGQAFRSLLSPTTLLTIGLIAGGAALIQWGMSAASAAGNSEALKQRQEQLKQITEELTNATRELTIARQLDQTGISTEVELNAARAIIDLRRQEADVTERINQLTVGRAAGLRTVEEGERKVLIEQRLGIQEKIRQLNYEQELAIAARRRSNEYRDQKRQEKEFQDNVNFAASQLEAIHNRIANIDLAAPIIAMLAPFDAAIEKAKMLANNMGMASGPAPDPTVPNTLGNSPDILFGNVPPDLGGAVNMPTSARPRSAPMGVGGIDWGASAAAGGRGGGGRAANAIQAQLEQLQNSLLTQEQLEAESFRKRQETLDQALQQRLISQQEHTKLMEQIEKTHQFAMLQQTNKGVTSTLTALGNLFQGSKKIGAAIALANSWIAFTEVLKDPAYIGRPFARFAAAASALSSGLNAVRQIKSASPGSSGSAGGGVTDGGATGGETGGGAAPQQVQTLNFTIQNDPFGYGERIARQIAERLNEAQRNGSTLIQATVS